MAGGIDWFRWHHGSVTDPKFQLVARRAGASLPDVLAVWAYLLEKASASEHRGLFGEIDAEALDCLFGFPSTETRTADILKAMRDRKLIDVDGVVAWERRQPKREDETAAERKRRQREREHEERLASAGVTGGASPTVTPRHADVTHGHDRGEERREEKKEGESALTLPAAPPAETEARAPQEPQGTQAGAVCKAMRQAGFQSTNPGDPRFLALLAQGATEAEFVGIAAEAADGQKGWAWVLKTLEGRRKDAAAINLAQRPEDIQKPWQETAAGIKAKGAELGMPWSDDGWVNGECIPFPTYKARVLRAAGATQGVPA